MNLKHLRILAVCFPLLGEAAPNLVVNGDFETPPVVNRVAGFDIYYGGQTFEGWAVGGHSIDIVNDEPYPNGNWWQAASGHQSIDLNGNSTGSIFQDVQTVTGATYYLSFAMAGNPFASIVIMDFYWQGQVVDTLLFFTNPDRSNPGWTYFEYPVVATTDLVRLSFHSLIIGGPNGPAVDDVVLSTAPRFPSDTSLEVVIDVKPGGYPNPIQLKSKGTVPVAIVSSPNFSASTVDVDSVLFAGAEVQRKPKGGAMASCEDVNSDGILDLVMHFPTTALVLSSSDTEATLTGATVDGQQIRGNDTVRVLP